MTSGTLVFYNSWKERIAKGANLASDTIFVALLTSGYTPSVLHETASQLSGEVSVAGYSRQAATGVAWTQSGGTANLDFADVTFSPSADMTARYYAVYDDTASSKPLICYGLLDGSGADVVVAAGGTLVIKLDPSGLFTLV